MSDSGEIKLKDTIYNEEIYDSDEEEDEEEETNYEFLENRNYESCAYTKNLTFVDKDEDCDFDKDEDRYPIMPDGGEEFFIPYMTKVSKNNKKFKGCVIETNVKNFSFVL